MSGDIDPGVFKRLVHHGRIRLAGNSKLRIYGRLGCCSGKRMKKENRVFFSSETEALHHGYRPCASCLRERYLLWKRGHHDGPLKAT